MKKKYKILLAVVLAVVCVATGAVYLLSPKPVLTQTVEYGVLADQFSVQGRAAPADTMVLRAPTTGYVADILLEAGRAATQGQELMTLDADLTQTQLKNQIQSLRYQQQMLSSQSTLQAEQIKLQLADARQQYARQFGEGEDYAVAEALHDIAATVYIQAKDDYNEAEDLGVDGSTLLALENQMKIARRNLLIAKADNSEETRLYMKGLIASYEAQLASLGNTGNASAAVRDLQVTIDYLTSKLEAGPVAAPYDGIVWELYVRPGDYVAENSPVARVYRPGSLRLEAQLLAQDAMGLRLEEVVSCRLPDGSELTGTIGFISPIGAESVSSIGLTETKSLVEITVQGLPEQLGAGQPVELTFSSVVADSVLSVPAVSLVPTKNGSGVYLVQAGRARLVEVQTGLKAGGWVEIVSGLTQGDVLITNPYEGALKNGSFVKPVVQ